MSNTIDLSKYSFKEVAAIISEEFRKENISIVLSGGACAQIYSKMDKVSNTLNSFILTTNNFSQLITPNP